MKKIAVIMGSASDLPVVRKAADTLKAFGVPHEVHVYSAHRTPDQAAAFARSARENGFAAIIAAAGMAGPPGRGPGGPDHLARHRHSPEIQRAGRR